MRMPRDRASLLAILAVQFYLLSTVHGKVRASPNDVAQVSASVSSGRGLAQALAKPNVVEIVLESSIILEDNDWRGLGDLPLLVSRSVTIRGPSVAGVTGDFPVFDINFIKNKIRLAAGVSLTLEHVILTRFSEQAPLPTISLDLIAHTEAGAAKDASYVWLLHAAINLRLCLPASLDQMALTALPRPPMWPGAQNSSLDLPQPGCIDDIEAPWLQQCWPARREYTDVASRIIYIGPQGQSLVADYAVRALDTDVLCSAVMPIECIQQLGPYGCFNSFLPDPTNPPPPPSPPPPAPPKPSKRGRPPSPLRKAPPPWWRRRGPPKIIYKP